MNKPVIHCLKVLPEFFPALACGDKTFEVRRDDRGFKAGDVLVLQEWDQVYTREAVTKIVTYVLHGGRFGLQEGHVVMGLKDYSAPITAAGQSK
jgi:Domain of unknown function (DUF3850)